MNNPPFFSVTISTLNEEKYLPKLLNSLASQIISNFEVIVVDASSNDKTVQAANNFKSKIKNLAIVKSSIRNLPHQRNLGAKKARGQYLVFFDADVMIPPRFLEKVHLAIKNKRTVLLTTRVEPNGTRLSDKFVVKLFNLATEFNRFIGRPLAHGPNTIIRRDVFFKIGGYKENVVMVEDHDLSLRANKAGYKVTILKEPKLILSLRRFRNEGIWRVIRLYLHAQLHLLLKGPITENSKFKSYRIGGHVQRGM